MKILATDLDRTLLPNGEWPTDQRAIPLFNQLTRDEELLVVYVTGRNLELVERAIREYGIRYPDVLISDVGTAIWHYQDQQWSPDEGWQRQLSQACPAWDVATLRLALTGIAGLTEQPAEYCGPFKQSYFLDAADQERILDQVDQAMGSRFDQHLIYSHDPLSGQGLLDIQPQSASKSTALTYLAEQSDVAAQQVVFCGDSGNDLQPLTAGFCGVLVRNADQQLLKGIEQARSQNPLLRCYQANGRYGLDGYYTAGVLEGAVHYGVLSEQALHQALTQQNVDGRSSFSMSG